jgi:hypothetical protein
MSKLRIELINRELAAAKLELKTLLGEGDDQPTQKIVEIDLPPSKKIDTPPPPQLTKEDEYIVKMKLIGEDDIDAATALTDALFAHWDVYRTTRLKALGQRVLLEASTSDEAFDQYMDVIATGSKSLYHIRRILFPGISSSLDGCTTLPTPTQRQKAKAHVIRLARQIISQPDPDLLDMDNAQPEPELPDMEEP